MAETVACQTDVSNVVTACSTSLVVREGGLGGYEEVERGAEK